MSVIKPKNGDGFRDRLALGRSRILIVDDEVQVRRFLRIALKAGGHEVIEATCGKEAIERCATDGPALMILDLRLPDMDGQRVISEVRQHSQVPIIVLSAQAAEVEKVEALYRGASDYVTKPFCIAELLARIWVVLRDNSVLKMDPIITVGDLEVDIPRHRAALGGTPLQITRKEFALLRVLAQHAGRLVTHKRLLREVWGPHYEENAHYLRVYVGRLRQKLGDSPFNPRFVATEPGIGYRLLLPDQKQISKCAIRNAGYTHSHLKPAAASRTIRL